jgi:hypothetical protein
MFNILFQQIDDHCLWLIDIKSVTSIIYDLFVLRLMVFNQKTLPF